jgi:polysaccharide pyruvyl transferase WcaK-like protein
MTIDIRGVNTHNKGAQLMMMAIAARLGSQYPLSTSPNGSSYDIRARLGLTQSMLLSQAPQLSARVSDLVPGSLRKAFGLTSDSDITGVLDASGFAYSDSFSAERSKRETVHARRWQRRGVPVVFLPQAFGPFTKADRAQSSRELLKRASLVFARDATSLDFIKGLDSSIPVHLSPDFTIGLSAAGVASPIDGEYAAIVPNSKMVSHTALGEQQYVDSLIAAGETASSAGLRPVVVIHEHNDLGLGGRISSALSCEVFSDPDPLVLKRVLGDAQIAIASRFHAIVGALSQETPVLAYGWSHKYGALLADFGVPDWELTGSEGIAEAVSALLADTRGRAAMHENKLRLLERNDEMWSMVTETLSAPRTSRA